MTDPERNEQAQAVRPDSAPPAADSGAPAGRGTPVPLAIGSLLSVIDASGETGIVMLRAVGPDSVMGMITEGIVQALDEERAIVRPLIAQLAHLLTAEHAKVVAAGEGTHGDGCDVCTLLAGLRAAPGEGTARES